jgi:hypothetical protein
MKSKMIFELQPECIVSTQPADIGELTWREKDPEPKGETFRVEGTDYAWARWSAAEGRLERLENSEGAEFCFFTVKRRLNEQLVMVTSKHDVLVNGVPALSITMLELKDSVIFGPNRIFYLNVRVRPHVGAPTKEIQRKKCPLCKTRFKEGTSVVTCYCEMAYHNETPETQPDIPEDELYRCFEKVERCLGCGKALTCEETLLWNRRC